MRSRQRGASAVFVLILVLFAMVGVLAAIALSRTSSNNDAYAQTTAGLGVAATALEQYAAIAQRLPCPANGATEDGVELPAAPTGNCDFPEGTLPWRTLGMRRDDSFDAWGRKISYRVYTGAAGSLTQPGGISMVNCDLIDPFPAATAGASGLCRATQDTPPAQFLQNKGLSVTDYGTVHNDAAYVLISHGETGRGAWTLNGNRKEDPAGGDELANTRANGPFTMRAASDSDTSVATGAHFDDVLFYRSVADVAARANLAARDWPEPPLASVRFDAPIIAAALGSPVTGPGDLGVSSLRFGNVRVRGFTGTSTAADLAYDTTGTSGIGVASASGNMLSAVAGTWLRVDVGTNARNFAITLSNFGTYGIYTESFEMRFYKGGSLVATLGKSPCHSGQGLATYTVNLASDYDNVQIVPRFARDSFGFFFSDTTFSVAEISACDATTPSCTTSLANASNTCP